MRLSFTLLLTIIAVFASASFAQESPSVQLFEGEQTQLSESRAPNEVKTIQIQAGQLQLMVNVEIASRDAGIVESIGFSEGKEIFIGDVLAKLNEEKENANARSARSELDIAREESENDIDLRYAKVSEDVNGKVYQRSLNATKQFAKSVSKTELERLKLELERAKLSGEQAERTATINELTVELKKAQLEFALVQLENREIKSPVSGVVVQVYRQVGEWVQSGQPIARVISLKKLRVSCRCQLNDAAPESIAKEGIFLCDGKEYKATVVFASPEIDPDVQDFIVWAEVENPEGTLKPGMGGAVKLRSNK